MAYFFSIVPQSFTAKQVHQLRELVWAPIGNIWQLETRVKFSRCPREMLLSKNGGTQNGWMVCSSQNPTKIWMKTGGSQVLGDHQMLEEYRRVILQHKALTSGLNDLTTE